jgi:hypothetical protein
MGAFSALALSEHRGMRSLGILLTVSILALLYCTLVVLPALVELRTRLTGRSEGLHAPDRRGGQRQH